MAHFGNLNVRRAFSVIHFNGANVSDRVDDYKKELSYTDPACDDSDTLDLTLHNIELDWLKDMYPVKGDEISGAVMLLHWNKTGDNQTLEFGQFVLDNVKFTGGPVEVSMTGVSAPADSSFSTCERTKVWEEVTLQAIGSEIAGKYGLSCEYQGPEIMIETLEQSQQTDSAFLCDTAGKYGISMKVFKKKIVLFDKGILEAKGPVATLTRKDFEGDDWEFQDSLDGVYTGARISYKHADDDEEQSIYIGLKGEDEPGSRVLRITEVADNAGDADRKARGQVNTSNEKATTLKGTIWPNTAIVSGVTVQVEEMGHANGKYFVDKMTFSISANSGTTQTVEMHKCQERL